MPEQIVVVGIHTDIGKTIASAVMTEAMQADYWKPVQAGDLLNSDSIKIARYVSNPQTKIHPEALKLQMAASPHTAAAAEGLQYDCRAFKIPATSNNLIIESAGGLFSPVDDQRTVLDFVKHFDLPVVLVTKNYLGSINHTLLCLEALRFHKIPLQALIINGARNESTESFIQSYAAVKNTLYIPELTNVDATTVKSQASEFLLQWQKLK